MSAPVGWDRHRDGVARLLRSYAAIPPDAPVRLRKRTSNLFRARDATRAPGLDVSGLGGVIEVDQIGGVAEVQGMCTYEHLVSATLAEGFVPLVVPQLRTITLGGAVTGLGIEATSFRNGLPHESVLEMDVLTGAGEVLTTRPGDELFDAFPNSYGSLGYATRLRIELEPAPRYAALRHLRFDDLELLTKTVHEIVETASWDAEPVHGLDGVVFSPHEAVLTLARWADDPQGVEPSDYTGKSVFYRSLQERDTDLLTMHDYLWRWDTDWFWCSRAFGAQNPVARAVWPRRLRRSDVYHRMMALDRRFGIAARLDARAGRPEAERVVQDVEVPLERLAEFLFWFDAEVGMRPVWLCPLRLRRAEGPGGDDTRAGRPWPTYPLEPHTTYVNVGFWGAVAVGPTAPEAPLNRAIEAKVADLDGHKSLYSEAFYDRETFDRLYDGPHLAAVKARHDPDDRLTSLYDKAVHRR
ncbi:FAD-binding oxidoreductase [Nocardioides cavernaquae]|uniref:Delta(24)-sterol reductase n=1 Tax=Nocardioides cavernaquae TaxID=2321396 RepID=A0A3A5HCM4_9ACTN|nr:FAD-binding oxidoreductase [Nocardioides cavernaquae]RJS47618.1 FAD-binding oxidoreductase [Nocardioides cavernaquae]